MYSLSPAVRFLAFKPEVAGDFAGKCAASHPQRIIPRPPVISDRRSAERWCDDRSNRQRLPVAKDRYAEAGVDTDAALARLAAVPISLHCWQGDDVDGFENSATGLGGGLAATGNYPGKARTPDELAATSTGARR